MTKIHVIVVASTACLLLSKNTFAQFVPQDLSPGDIYHLVFVTEGTTNAIVGKTFDRVTLSDYDAFVQGEAAKKPELTGTDQGVEYRAIVTAWDAPNNRETLAAEHAIVTAPVYRLDGELVADGFIDIWDGAIDQPISITQNGDELTGAEQFVWTGTNIDGERGLCVGVFGERFPAGLTQCLRDGALPSAGDATSAEKWVASNAARPLASYHYYGLSGPLAVPIPEPTASTLLSIGFVILMRQRRAGNFA